jgi:hypothetical protein
MSQLVAVRSSDLRTVVADVPLKVARGMVARGEARWTGNSRSIQLHRAVLSAGSLECRKGLIELFDYQGPGMSRGAQESNPYENGEVIAGT